MQKPSNPKERGLAKGALRRVFSRSELRKEALSRHAIKHEDPNRPRVTKWSWCGACGLVEPTYKMEVDHVEPVVPVHTKLEDMSWDELIERLWCDVDNLMPVCKDCHKEKTKLERKLRGKKNGSR